VGRAEPQAEVTELLAQGPLATITGEGGIGKTRLAAELALTVEATGGRVLTARCYTGERSLFLQPIVDALDSTLGALPAARLRTIAGPRATALAGLWPGLVDELEAPVEHRTPEIEVRRTFEAVTAVLRGLAAERRPCCCSTTCTRPAWRPWSCCTTWRGTPHRRGCSCSRHCAPMRAPTPSTSWPTFRSGSTSARCRTRR